MGSSIQLELAPYIKVRKSKIIEVPKIKKICSKCHPNFNAKDEKFCPNCGSEIVSYEYSVAQELRPYMIFRNANLDEESLVSIQWLENVLLSREYPPDAYLVEERQSGETNLLGQQDVMIKQIAWFKEKYEKHIDVLIEAYGAENVTICWGLIRYWS